MTPQPILPQLEVTLRQIVHEHRSLLAALEAHEAALRSCSLDKIERATREQDFARQRIAQTEGRRRVLVHQLGRQHRLVGPPPTLAKLGELNPDRKAALSQLRQELADVAAQVQKKSSLLARIASSVLGHVNATLRLVSHAAAGPAAYTRSGDAPLPRRIGVLNAVA